MLSIQESATQAAATIRRDEDLASLPGCAYVDSRFVPLSEARISILDRGFVRSDATYDVAHVWKGRFFRLHDHVERFFASMASLRLDPGLSRDEVIAILVECVARSGLRDAYVQMTCTRGVPPRGTRDPRLCVNRFSAFVQPFVWIANAEQRERGLRMIVSSIERIPPTSIDPRIKNFHWLDLTGGILEALDQGAEVAVLVDRDRCITEGAGFNVFVVEKGCLATPEAGVFEGMTRRTVFDLCAELRVPCRVDKLAAEHLAAADEIFVTSTAGGIMPVTVLGGDEVGTGRPGPITTRLHDLYWSKKEAGWLSTPVSYLRPDP